MYRKFQMILAVFLLGLFIALPMATASSEYGRHQYDRHQETAGMMIGDALVVRPLGILATVTGGALFIVSLPFSLLGSNADEAYQRLVADPARFTFARKLGEF
jgi:hypothetical protein